MTPTILKYRDRFRKPGQMPFNFDELVIDNFAGGGGASTGIEQALGRPIDFAINHDPGAVAMHEVNHPHTKHFCESVWDMNPREVCGGRPVGLVWFSPDCKHFSKAKGKKPVEKKIRGLAWVVLRWAATVRPRVIMLENVEEFVTWGPLVTDPNGDCYPCPKNKGRTFASFKNALRKHGYEVEHKELRACDYGAPTIRKRLFLVARCDGQAIEWPEPTHGDPKSAAVTAKLLKPWRTAAECIDWDIPAPSIFERKKPLADATLRRIAKGTMRYVVNTAEPFIIPIAHYNGSNPAHFIRQPLRTVTAWPKGGHLALVTPFVSTYYGAKSARDARGARLDKPIATQTTENRHALVVPTLIGAGGPIYSGKPRPLDLPMGTIMAENHQALCTAFLAKHYGGLVGHGVEQPIGTVTTSDHHSLVTAHLIRQFGQSVGSSPLEPVGTITPGGLGKTGLIASHLVKLRGTCADGQPVTVPLHTISAQGQHFGEVRAFLLKYYGSDQDPQMLEPLHTVTTRDRFGLVTVRGEEFQIIDIGMRMLAPRELFRAQGFPEDYIIDRDSHGKPITKTEQVKRCGNSVSPYPAEALVRANMNNVLSAATYKEAMA